MSTRRGYVPMASCRVLVVDDERPVVDLAARVLGAAGFEVLSASSAGQALTLIRGKKPVDLVVSDVVMPGMQGPQLVEEIQRAWPSTRAVLMSGYADVDLPPQFPFLRKPFTPQDLILAVKRALRRSAEAQQGLREARAEGRRLREERRRICEELHETTRRSKKVIGECSDRLERGRKNR